jgi:ankyrin repeat protein
MDILSAAASGYIDFVKEYIKKYKANKNISTLLLNNALHEASRGGYYEIVELLLENGAKSCNNNMESNIYGDGDINCNTVSIAVKNGQYSVVKLLLDYGALGSDYSLYYALEKKYYDIASLLIENERYHNMVIINTPKDYSRISYNNIHHIVTHHPDFLLLCNVKALLILMENSLINKYKHLIQGVINYRINSIKRSISVIHYKLLDSYYKPEGIGYYKAKKHFEELIKFE